MVLALLVGTTAITGIITVNGGFANAFNQSISQENLETLEKQRNITNQLNTGKKRASKVGQGIESGFFALTQIWNAIKAMIASIPVANALIHQLVVILGLPPWIETLGNGVAAAILVFGIIRLYRGVTP